MRPYMRRLRTKIPKEVWAILIFLANGRQPHEIDRCFRLEVKSRANGPGYTFAFATHPFRGLVGAHHNDYRVQVGSHPFAEGSAKSFDAREPRIIALELRLRYRIVAQTILYPMVVSCVYPAGRGAAQSRAQVESEFSSNFTSKIIELQAIHIMWSFD
jgi:hypothetical protein